MRPQVLLIGDSISLGYGPYLETALSGRAACVRVGPGPSLVRLGDPAAENGGDSRKVVQLLRTAGEMDSHFDLAVVNCGLHDIKTDPTTGEKQVPLGHYQDNLEQIISLAGAVADRMVWVRTTPVDDQRHNSHVSEFHRHARDVEDYNRAADRVMAEAGVLLIDLCRFTEGLGAEVYCDHVHFTDPVRREQAGYIASHLAPVLDGLSGQGHRAG